MQEEVSVMQRLKSTKNGRLVLKFLVALFYGVISAISINWFLSNAHSYSVGVTGLSQLVQGVLELGHISISLSWLILIFNIPLFIFAWRAFDAHYLIFSLLAVVFSSIFISIIPHEQFVSDPLTNSVIGAALFGFGIGYCFNYGFTTGGTDIIVSYAQVKYHKKVGAMNNIVNGIILIGSAIAFGPERIIYSLIGMLITSFTMDYVFVWQKDVSVSIFTKKPQAMTKALKHWVHGATLLSGTGIYTGEPTDVIVVVAQKGQVNMLKHLVKATDPQSFITVVSASAEMGNYNRQLFND